MRFSNLFFMRFGRPIVFYKTRHSSAEQIIKLTSNFLWRNRGLKSSDDLSVLVDEELSKVPTYLRLSVWVRLCFFELFVKLARVRSIDLYL